MTLAAGLLESIVGMCVMELRSSLKFDPDRSDTAFFESVPARPAVFALFAEASKDNPYLSRARDLRRRLKRLLGAAPGISRRLNLRAHARRVEYSLVGSAFESQWLLYTLNKRYYPKVYRHRLRLRPPALLKLNLANRFPRLFPTRRISNDGAAYYGPFPSRAEAERWAGEFLDFFKIRRCVEDLSPDPSHPGCVYSQMKMCLAPCFRGCTDEEYDREVGRVTEALDGGGQPLVRILENERGSAAESLEFELAAKIHRRIEKANEVLRTKPDLVHNLRDLHGVIVERGAEPQSVVFFRVCAGELRGPATLPFEANVSNPAPLDEQLHTLLDSLAPKPDPAGTRIRRAQAPGKPEILRRGISSTAGSWEHLSLLARWYYSSFREGEFVALPPDQRIPHARLIRICRKILANSTAHQAEARSQDTATPHG